MSKMTNPSLHSVQLRKGNLHLLAMLLTVMYEGCQERHAQHVREAEHNGSLGGAICAARMRVPDTVWGWRVL